METVNEFLIPRSVCYKHYEKTVEHVQCWSFVSSSVQVHVSLATIYDDHDDDNSTNRLIIATVIGQHLLTFFTNEKNFYTLDISCTSHTVKQLVASKLHRGQVSHCNLCLVASCSRSETRRRFIQAVMITPTGELYFTLRTHVVQTCQNHVNKDLHRRAIYRSYISIHGAWHIHTLFCWPSRLFLPESEY
jgi:hypothetical protein